MLRKIFPKFIKQLSPNSSHLTHYVFISPSLEGKGGTVIDGERCILQLPASVNDGTLDCQEGNMLSYR